MSFEVPEPTRSGHIDPDQIRDKVFPSAWKGYRIEEVRGFLSEVAQGVSVLASELESLRSQVGEMGARASQTEGAGQSDVSKAEEAAAQILHDANEAARALRDQARSYLESTREMADEEAKKIVDDAQRPIGLLDQSAEGLRVAQLEEASKRELEEARKSAYEIVEQAKTEGRAMIDQARDLRNDILADLRHKKNVLDSEIADLATRRIEAYQSLARAVQLISEAGAVIASSEREESRDQDDGALPQARILGDGDPDLEDGEAAQEFNSSGPLSSLTTSEGYRAKIVSSQVEMGGHLEEGIVRVFHKDSEMGPWPEHEFQNYGLAEEGSGPDSAVAVGDAQSAESQSTADLVEKVHQVPVSESMVSEDSLESSHDRETSDVVHEPENLVDQSSERDIDVKEGFADLPEVPLIATDGNSADREVRESRSGASSLEAQVPSSAPGLQADEAVQISRRADEILARIRSLRSGVEEPVHARSDGGGLSDGSYSELSSAHLPYADDATGGDPGIHADGDSSTRGSRLPSANGLAESDEDIEEPGDALDPATRELIEVREELLSPIADMLFKKVRRLLSDEQNDLLDKVRRSSGSHVTLENLLEEKDQIDAMAIASLDFFEQVRLGIAELFSRNHGATLRREISRHAADYSEEFAKEVALPLRRRIEEALANDSTAEDQSTAAALGAIYRDVRSNRLAPLISQYVNTVFCATIMLESGFDSFAWVVDPQDPPCADCLDNSLAGTTIRGEQFPTGHRHPAIHTGCRCILVPFIA